MMSGEGNRTTSRGQAEHRGGRRQAVAMPRRDLDLAVLARRQCEQRGQPLRGGTFRGRPPLGTDRVGRGERSELASWLRAKGVSPSSTDIGRRAACTTLPTTGNPLLGCRAV